MVYHVNDCVAATANYNYSISSILDEMERAQEMLVRLNCMDPNAPVPQEIADYIESYAGLEGLFQTTKTAADYINAIIVTLHKALVKIYEIICEVFKMMFDSQYRHRKEFIDINRGLTVLASDPDAVRRFEEIPCQVISNEDALGAIFRNKLLIDLLKIVSSEGTSHDEINRVMGSFCEHAAVKFDHDQIVENIQNFTAKHWSSFKEAGWTVNATMNTIYKHIDCISGIETLKDVESKLKKEISSLDKEVNERMAQNRSSEEITDLQKRVALRIRLVRCISTGINVLVTRYNAISNVLRAINSRAKQVLEIKRQERNSR